MKQLPESCPQCKNREFDEAGFCLVCGYTARAEGSVPQVVFPPQSGGEAGLEEGSGFAPPEAAQSDLPRWRRELAQRLQEIRQRREMGSGARSALTLPFPRPVESSEVAHETRPATPKAGKVLHHPVRGGTADRPVVAPMPARSTVRKPRAVRKAPASLPLFETARAEGRPASVAPIPSVTDPDPQAIEHLIDSIMARQACLAPATPETTDRIPLPIDHQEGRLILLSRTLSGLTDLLIVILCAGSFIIAADVFSGIEKFDTVSSIYYGMLLLAIYFVYSVFFLGTANQTIGMMITELRVVGREGRRPSAGQIFGRCAAYLLSLLLLGTGLLWGCLSRESRCLHDRLSGTRVVRL
jgi:uncharacterized RDD family membrane protein YckC